MNPNIDQLTGTVGGRRDDARSESVFVAPGASATDRGRRHRRGRRLAVTTLALTAALGGAVGADPIVAAPDAPPNGGAERPPSPCSADDDLWDRVRMTGIPEHWWEPVAAAMWLTPRSPWISLDGLTWEHLDGRRVVVATPRSPTTSPIGGRTCS